MTRFDRLFMTSYSSFTVTCTVFEILTDISRKFFKPQLYLTPLCICTVILCNASRGKMLYSCILSHYIKNFMRLISVDAFKWLYTIQKPMKPVKRILDVVIKVQG